MRRALLVLVLLAACGKDHAASKARDAGPFAKCKPVPACFPAQPTPGSVCNVAGITVTCPRCGSEGGLLECRDLDEDGCPEEVRTECGRKGCADMECTAHPDQAQNRFGVVGPAGFVDCDDATAIPVDGDHLNVQVMTRATYPDPLAWSVGLTGAGLSIPAVERPAEIAEIDDDYAILRQSLDVRGFDPAAKDVELVFTLKGPRDGMLRITCGSSWLVKP